MTIPYIPFFTTSHYRVTTMIDLSEIKKGQRVADLGSGDGRIAISFAKIGGIVDGFELDEKLLEKAKAALKKEKVTGSVTFKKEDFWEADLSSYDIVAMYPMPDVMKPLEDKLLKELRPGTCVLLNYYTFENWKYETTKNKIYRYIR